MAYPTVMDACLDNKHDACEEVENVPTDPDVCGGGFCICLCHLDGDRIPNVQWFLQVRKEAMAAREARERRGT